MSFVPPWSPVSIIIFVIQRIQDPNRLASSLADPISLVPHDHPFPSELELQTSPFTPCLLSLPLETTHPCRHCSYNWLPYWACFICKALWPLLTPGSSLSLLLAIAPTQTQFKQAFTAPNIAPVLEMKKRVKSWPRPFLKKLSIYIWLKKK